VSLLLPIISIALLWGVGNVFVKRGYAKLTPWQTYALDALFIAAPVWLTYSFLIGFDITKINFGALATALFAAATYALFYYVISIGEISLTSAIIATYPVFTLILAFLFLKESLTPLALLGIFLSIFGVILISAPPKLKFKLEGWVIGAILVSLGYGVLGYWQKIVLTNVDNATYIFVLTIAQIAIVGLWRLFLKKEKLPKIKMENFLFSAIGIFFFNIGMIIYYIALEKGLASVVVSLSNTYIVVTVLLSLLWLKEKITIFQMIGIVSVVIGVVLVGFNI
jgi:uncharacterized membrane protein